MYEKNWGEKNKFKQFDGSGKSNKKADDKLAGIPLRALIRARPVRN